MERCANTEALNKYEKEQDEAEQRHDAFTTAVDEEIYSIWEDMETIFEGIAKQHGFEDDNLFEYIRKNW